MQRNFDLTDTYIVAVFVGEETHLKDSLFSDI